MIFIYHNFIIILSRVYNDQFNYLLPVGLVGQLHRSIAPVSHRSRVRAPCKSFFFFFFFSGFNFFSQLQKMRLYLRWFSPNTQLSPKSPLPNGALCYLVWNFVINLATVRHFCHFCQIRCFAKFLPFSPLRPFLGISLQIMMASWINLTRSSNVKTSLSLATLMQTKRG